MGRFEEDYKQIREEDTPDMWDKIEKGLDELDAEKNELTEEEIIEFPVPEKKKRRWILSALVAAAACLVCVIALPALNNAQKESAPDNAKVEMAENDTDYDLTTSGQKESTITAVTVGKSDGSETKAPRSENETVPETYMTGPVGEGKGGKDTQDATNAPETEAPVEDFPETEIGETEAPKTVEAFPAELEPQIITVVTISAETDDMKTFAGAVEDGVLDHQGFMEAYGITETNEGEPAYAYFIARVPAEKLDSFIKVVSENCTMKDESRSTEDAAVDFYSIEKRLNALSDVETQINEMLSRTENEDEKDYLNNSMSEIGYERDYLNSLIDRYGNKVEYSTVYITVNEISE